MHLTAASEEAAGNVTYDMHRQLLKSEIESYIITPLSGGKQNNVIRLHTSRTLYKFYHYRRLAEARLGGGKRYRLLRKPEFHFNVYSEEMYYSAEYILRKLKRDVDAIIVHFYDGFLNTATVVRLGQITGARIFWLMMDMAPLTGGCHYAWDCDGYTRECGRCVALYSDNEHDRSYEQFELKKKLLDSYEEIELIAASEWQYRQAKSSTLYGSRRIHKLLTSVNPDVYQSAGQSTHNDLNAFKDCKNIILFGARFLNEKRKGFHLFVEVMDMLKKMVSKDIQENTVILVAGEGDAASLANTGWTYHHFGNVSNEELAQFLSKASIYVCASIEDSGPTMINQAMMCGTPVVSFEMGVALDLVHDGQTGYRVPHGDTMRMADKIALILNASESDHMLMRANCRAMAMEACHPEKQMKKLEAILFNH